MTATAIDADAAVAGGNEERGIAGEDHRDGRDDPGVHAPEHRPAPQEAGERRERVAHENVDAAGLRKRGRQLRADQRAEQRQHAARDPDEHDLARRVEVPRDLGRLHEDRRADDRSGDHRGRMDQRERAGQLDHWPGMVTEREDEREETSWLLITQRTGGRKAVIFLANCVAPDDGWSSRSTSVAIGARALRHVLVLRV